MKKLIFLHGYGGIPIPEVTEIFKVIGWETIQHHIDYDLEWDRDRCKSITEKVVGDGRDCDLIIGLSLGGYTAHLVSNHLVKDCILINPGIDREKSQVFLGNQFPVGDVELNDTKDFDFPMYFNKCRLEVYLGRRDFQIPNNRTTDYLKKMGIIADVYYIEKMYHIFNIQEFIDIIKNSKFIDYVNKNEEK